MIAMHRARGSIAGLMGAVAVAAFGLAALRSPAPATGGAVIMTTCGVLALAVVGVACDELASRVWWLGFVLFGSTYLVAAFFAGSSGAEFPTIALLVAVASKAGAVPTFVPAVGAAVIDPHYLWIGHSLWSVALGLLGAVLARLLFHHVPAHADGGALEAGPPSTTARRWWNRPGLLLVVLAALVVLTSLALLGSSSENRLWPGATILLTPAILGIAVLGAVLSRGKSRARWLGAAVFGLGYVALVMLRHPDIEVWPRLVTEALESAADPLLRLVVRGYADSTDSIAAENARVWRALARRIPMRLNNDSDASEVFKYIEDITRDSEGRRISIDFDSTGLHGVSVASIPVAWSIDWEAVPLRTSLRLFLAKVGESYYVRDGILHIYSLQEGAPVEMDAYLLVGHCLIALFAAGFGALAAGIMWEAPGRANPRQN
jgi:hypothetical protein